MAVERLEVPLGTIWLFGPLCRKCRKNPIFIIPLSSHFFHSPEQALGGRAEGVSDTRRHKRDRCPRLSAELAPSSLPGALPPTRRPQRRRFYHRPPSVAPRTFPPAPRSDRSESSAPPPRCARWVTSWHRGCNSHPSPPLRRTRINQRGHHLDFGTLSPKPTGPRTTCLFWARWKNSAGSMVLARQKGVLGVV